MAPERRREDDLLATQRLAAAESESADVITQLDPTRGIVSDAMNNLRGEREAQVNLAGIPTATRIRTLVPQGEMPTKCPKKLCYTRESFWHMLARYGLETRVARGTDAALFLVKMARGALLAGPFRPIVYPRSSPLLVATN